MREKFHSFDALRFISFLIVFFSHLPYKYFPSNFFKLLQGRGNIGVTFFFILSGFLITYLLLIEKKEQNVITYKKFLFRRILRIWPLFYTMLLFAFLMHCITKYFNLNTSNIGYTPNWVASFFFLENYQVILQNKYANVPPVSVFWSLCVEEHFYIIWGIILFFCNKKHLFKSMVLLITISWVTKYLFSQYNLKPLEILTNFDFFMYGAIPAFLLVYKREQTLTIIKNTSYHLKLFIFVTTICVIFFSGYVDLGYLGFLENSLYGIIFGLLLCVFLPQNNPFKISDKNLFSKLGTYTYGLYMTHIICIILFEKIFLLYNLQLEDNFIVYTSLSLLLTIIASYFTYQIIEKPFLKLKTKFST